MNSSLNMISLKKINNLYFHLILLGFSFQAISAQSLKQTQRLKLPSEITDSMLGIANDDPVEIKRIQEKRALIEQQREAAYKNNLLISNANGVLNTRTFTNAAATGRTGPTQAQVDTAYGSGVVTINTQGIQEWTVPASGTYTIEAWGAQGGDGTAFAGGKGARMKANIDLTQNDVLLIVVGQQGASNTQAVRASGGGGGTFVAKKDAAGNHTPLIIAGGGSGVGGNESGSNGGVGNPGLVTLAAGVGDNCSSPGAGAGVGVGNGGSGAKECNDGAGGGGGWLSDGISNSAWGFQKGYGFLSGSALGGTSSAGNMVGGFGGGAGTHYHNTGGGAGGGYTGGGAPDHGAQYNGGGGGSYITGTTLATEEGVQEDHGKVTITLYNDNTAPTISSTTLDYDNKFITVTMTEEVFNTNGGSGNLEASDFTLSLSGGNATLSSSTPNSYQMGGVDNEKHILGLSLNNSANGSEVITVNPVDNSIYDAAGNEASTSQSNNTVTLANIGTSLHFDGSDDYVNLIDKSIAVQGDGARTISAWVRTSQDARAISTGSTGTKNAFNLVIIDGIVGVMGHGYDFYPTSGTNIKDGKWHYLSVTYDSGTLKIYVDATVDTTTLVNNDGDSLKYETTGQDNYLGQSNHECCRSYFKGNIDEVGFWDEALTASEITALYNSGLALDARTNSGNYSSATNLTAYYKMEDGSGASLTDLSGYQNDGIIEGPAWPMGKASTSYDNSPADRVPPSTPSSLSASPLSSSSITLSWSANSEQDFTSYKVYGGTSPSPTTLLATISKGTESLTHSNLTSGKTYYYRISAMDNSSNESVKTSDVPVALMVPTNFTSFEYLNSLNGHSYWVSKDQQEWLKADTTTRNEHAHGHLITISSESENNIALQAYNLKGETWIGLNDISVENEWAWVTGEPVTYTNWNSGEPNNSGGGEDYVEIWANGVWNDNQAHDRFYVLEIDSDSTIYTPYNLVATSRYRGASLSWTATPGAVSYNIYWTHAGDSTFNAAGSTNSNSTIISSMTPGNSYVWKVSAVGSFGNESALSTGSAPTLASGAIFVTTDGDDSNSGYSLAEGYATVKKAVSQASSNDTIYIASGTYTFSSPDDGNISLDGSKNLIITGAGVDSTIIDANQKSRHFYFSYNSTYGAIDSSFQIKDLTLKNGKPPSGSGAGGGSILIEGQYGSSGHSPLFKNIIFEKNQSRYELGANDPQSGGAVAARSWSNPFFRDVTFKYNHTNRLGGAVHIDSPDTNKVIVFERTVFLGNNAISSGFEMESLGGAVYVAYAGKVIFESATFDSNYVSINGGCCSNRGGAINSYVQYDSLIVRNSTFKANSVFVPSGNDGGHADGGAISLEYAEGDFLLENSLFDGNYALSGNKTYSNGDISQKPSSGGAIYIDQRVFHGNTFVTPYKSILVNNTFVNNEARFLSGSSPNKEAGIGGALRIVSGKPIIFNNIFSNNRALAALSWPDSSYHEIYINSDIFKVLNLGFNSWDYSKDMANSFGYGNLDLEPNFLGGEGNDKYKLSDASLLIGSGSKRFEDVNAPSKDILGRARPEGQSEDEPDLGAYENPLSKTTFPDKVINLIVNSGGSRTAVLSWSANVDTMTKKYSIYQSTADGFSPTVTDSIGETENTNFTASGLSNGTPYFFRVRAINSLNQNGQFSDQADFIAKFQGEGGWHVATAENGGAEGNEGTKGSPMLYLKTAIESASSGDTIMVGNGTHSYSTSSKWNIDLNGNKSLVIKGAGRDQTILDAEQKDRHFIFNNNGAMADTTFKIMDITLANGRPKEDGWAGSGGSVRLNGAWDNNNINGHSPLFENVMFKSNQTKEGNPDKSNRSSISYGGAVFGEASNPSFRNTVFQDNLSITAGAAIAILYPDTNKIISFEKTTFINNQILFSGSETLGSMGAGIYLEQAGPVIINNSIFDGNALALSGECCWNGGAAVMISGGTSPVIVRNSKFLNNHIYTPQGRNGGTAKGGAIFISDVNGDFELINSLFVNNSAEAGLRTDQGKTFDVDAQGGALYIRLSFYVDQNGNPSAPYESRLINNTFVENKAFSSGNLEGRGANISYDGYNKAILLNNIFAADTVNNIQNPQSFEEYSIAGLFNGEIFSGYNNSDREQLVGLLNEFGDNNIQRDPSFLLDEGQDPYQLSDASRLIGAGALSYDGYQAPSVDILGNSRPTADPDRPDIGAYENAYITPPFPDRVRDIVVTSDNKTLLLDWAPNIEADLDKYMVYMSLTKGFDPATADSVYEVAGTESQLMITGLTNLTPYYFRLAAVNTIGNQGEISDEFEGVPQYVGPVWWVSLDGDDANDGSPEYPFANIAVAVERAFDGNIINVREGTYYNQTPIENFNKSISIIGVAGAENTIIDQENNRHHINFFGDNTATSVLMRGLKLINGSGVEKIGGVGEVHQIHSFIIQDCIFENNESFETGGALFIQSSSTNIQNSAFINNKATQLGGAIFWQGAADDSLKISQTSFEGNYIDTNNNLDLGYSGGALAIISGWHVLIKDSHFEGNWIKNSQNQWTSGGAISNFMSDPLNEIRILRTKFIANEIRGQQGSGAALRSNGNAYIENSLFAFNDGGQPHTILFNHGDKHVLINNTFAFNGLAQPTSKFASTLETHTLGDGQGSTAADVYMLNNIMYGNQSGGADVLIQDQATTLFGNHNLIDNGIQADNADVVNERNFDPQFKNPNGYNFSLKFISDAIDGGGGSIQGIYNAPIEDIRDFYRVGIPDLGAYEFGSSKYVLSIFDDLPLNNDTTFVKLDQEIVITVVTNDGLGNLVESNEIVDWSIFPNDKYVSIVSEDSTTEGGDATVKIKVTDSDKGKGFRFRVEASVAGEIDLASDLYIIEEVVTGAPPVVTSLAVNHATWTNEPEFTLTWENPNWQRDLIGASIEINDGEGNSFAEFAPYPEGDVLTSFTGALVEAGEYTVSIWLVDELGNSDPSTSDSVTVQFDNLPPNPFIVMGPDNGDWAPDKPTFYFEDRGDYPSGVKEYMLYVNENLVQTYTDISLDQGMAYVEINDPLSDGLYNWYMETKDMAQNVTRSDTAYFGVDLSPPEISHSNPLTTIDENTTSPSINANFNDAASGVSTGRLHYRRAGSGGGFVTVDLLSGPVNIPGSDIKKEGLEYYIDSEDNLGNYGYWPGDKAFQSVKVRTENNITSNGRWANGVPGGTEINSYELFSIPFDVGNAKGAITTVMGQADEFKYRLYEYIGGAQPWVENPSSVTMGNAYFFIYDPSKYEDTLPIQFNFGQGVSTSTDPPYEKPISAGEWVLLGSPYSFNIPISNIYTEDGSSLNDAGSIYTWNGSWNGVGSNLEPWKGYAYKSSSATSLIFDARGSGFGKMAKSVANGDAIPMDSDEWIIDIMATTGESRDEMNAVGVRHLAKDGYDRFDEFEPPVVPGNLTLRVDNRKREVSPDLYAKDIRKPNEVGHYWDIQVLAPTNGQRTYLTFDGLGYIPQEYDIFLINKTTKQAKNLEWESRYRFANTGSESYLKQDLRLVVGTKQFVEDNNAGVNLYPDAFTLAQNYPNPFNPQTSIMISLEQDAQVDLIVYNLLGEQIAKLAANERRPAGYYNFIWNGRNDMGTKVATGVYFYHALIRNEQGKVVLNKTKKMIFLK